MQKFINFLEQNMTRAVFITTCSSILQVLGYISPTQNGPISDEILKQIMGASSGLQAVMLIVLYLFLKFKK